MTLRHALLLLCRVGTQAGAGIARSDEVTNHIFRATNRRRASMHVCMTSREHEHRTATRVDRALPWRQKDCLTTSWHVVQEEEHRKLPTRVTAAVDVPVVKTSAVLMLLLLLLLLPLLLLPRLHADIGGASASPLVRV